MIIYDSKGREREIEKREREIEREREWEREREREYVCVGEETEPYKVESKNLVIRKLDQISRHDQKLI